MTDDHREPLFALTLCEAADGIAAGRFAAEDLVRACLERIAARESLVRAWAWVDPEGALRAARDADAALLPGNRAPGPLHGVPIGIKMSSTQSICRRSTTRATCRTPAHARRDHAEGRRRMR